MFSDIVASGAFSFSGVAPGKYVVTASHENWCWSQESEQVDVGGDKDIEDLKLVQSGFSLNVDVSHETRATIASQDGHPKNFSLSSGSNRFCLKHPGIYRLAPHGCVKFQQDEFTFDTSHPEALTLKATAFLVSGEVVISCHHSNARVSVTSAGSPVPVTITMNGVTEFSGSHDEGKYEYSFWGVPNTQYVITALADSGPLFYPDSRVISFTEAACPPAVEPFVGRMAMYVIITSCIQFCDYIIA